jgi:glycosyltransferase involved in cell wall biosynthesis
MVGTVKTASRGQEPTALVGVDNHARRLLFLLPHVPGPLAPTGGARSTFQLIAGLSKRHRIAVLCLRFPIDPPTDDALHRACDVVEEVASETSARHDPAWLRRMQAAVSPMFTKPGWVRVTDVASYRQRLRSLAKNWAPDLVHIGYHVMGQYACELQKCPAPRVLTEYEPGVTAARDAARGSHGLGRVRARLEIAAWERYERQVINQVDAVVALTESDRQALAPLADGVPLERIPLGISIPAKPLDPCGSPAPTVLFVGNFIHPPNVDAALWLIRSIFPLVRRARPDARLVVVGPDPPGQIMNLASRMVTVAGAVESVLPFLNEATVVVAPLRRGGGMRVKVMEALAAGKAVVATRLAAAGLEVVDGQQLLIADRSEEFAGVIAQLLNDRVARQRLAQSARTWAAANLNWDRSIAAYEALQDRLLVARTNRGNIP